MNRKLAGFLVVVAAAFLFFPVQSAVYGWFASNTFETWWSIGMWATPYEVLENILSIVVITIIARAVVGVTGFISYAEDRKMFLMVAGALFIALHYWTQPIVGYLSTPATTASRDIFGSDVWRNYWLGFESANLLSYIPATLMVLGAEMLRRKIVNAPPRNPKKLGLFESIPRFMAQMRRNNIAEQTVTE